MQRLKCPECGTISYGAYGDEVVCPCGALLTPEADPLPRESGGEYQGNRRNPVMDKKRLSLTKWRP